MISYTKTSLAVERLEDLAYSEGDLPFMCQFMFVLRVNKSTGVNSSLSCASERIQLCMALTQ